MKRVLRSIIDFDGTISQENLKRNFFELVESKLKFERLEDKEIYDAVFDYQDRFKGEIPTAQTLKDIFDEDAKLEVLKRLEEISSASSYFRTGFIKLIHDLYEEQQRREFASLLRETALVLGRGLEVGKEKIRGVKDALRHFIKNSEKFVTVGAGKVIKADVLKDKDDFLIDYYRVKNDPTGGIGYLTGIEKVDVVCRGARTGELWLVAGFTGEGKTTFCLNWAYNLVVYYGCNVYYITLEMSYSQVRRILNAIHSSNLRFRDIHEPLDYIKIRDGLLDEDEEKFLQLVASDFESNPEYGKLIIEQPDADVAASDIKLKVETEHRKNPIDVLFVDEARLVETPARYSDYTINLNYVLKDLKRLALTFNGGEGILVVTPFQTNRTGWNHATKNNGDYRLDALSYANEAERASDGIITIYMDDNLRDVGEAHVGNLKNRDNDRFKSFNIRAELSCRRFSNLIDITEGGMVDELEFL